MRLDARQIEPRKSDWTIDELAAANGGRCSVHIHLAHGRNATQDYAQAHVRRLEAIRLASGAVERLPYGSWKIVPDHLDFVREYGRGVASRSPVTVTTLATEPVGVEAHKVLIELCLTKQASAS